MDSVYARRRTDTSRALCHGCACRAKRVCRADRWDSRRGSKARLRRVALPWEAVGKSALNLKRGRELLVGGWFLGMTALFRAVFGDSDGAIPIAGNFPTAWWHSARRRLESWSVIEVRPLSAAEAREVALWRYESPYDFYDGSEAEVSVMLDPVNRYCAVHVAGEFVGYVCVGPDALVSGQHAGPGINDIGWGFRPDLTGRGLASRWLRTALDLLDDLLQAPTQRVVIAAWNQRSRAVALSLGFGDPVPLTNADGDWVILSRSRPTAS